LKLYFYFAAACLHPKHVYMMEPTPEMFDSLKDTFQSVTDLQTAVQALQEAEVFRRKHGDFAKEVAMRTVIDPKTSPCEINSVRHCCFLFCKFRIDWLLNRFYLHMHMPRRGG
jgi:hypothetical protein